MTDPWAEAERYLKRISGFANDMRQQGIHVGWGSPPRCVVDGEDWPCPHERDKSAPTS